ncbi:hypothetical protein [Mycobacterium sp. shizuoka-1]|uniref:hypothetical protein n=1 Tax=Mycobacterium sp. shizuoka-1 TaxID=2039281 RepID=UPI000C05D472|nr:hypothetical protein [Mycobacterium sp. shizuoka-1]GAY16240.1 hypothetical protein MSZK_29660 [Mycobacterium sp. shizuoka-1]
MKLADWISLASFVAAAISAAVAVLQARRAATSRSAAQHHEARAEHDAERAIKAAEQAAAWQLQAAAAAQRSADALEQQNRLVEERAEQAEGVPWEIRHNYGDTYNLVNVTTTAKFGVQISGRGVAGEQLTFDRIDGRSSSGQFGIAPFGAEFSQVDVTWHRREDLSDTPQRWSGNKPPKV